VEALPIVDVFVDAVMERALGEQGEGVGGSASGAWSRAPTSGASRPRTLTVPSSSGYTCSARPACWWSSSRASALRSTRRQPRTIRSTGQLPDLGVGQLAAGERARQQRQHAERARHPDVLPGRSSERVSMASPPSAAGATPEFRSHRGDAPSGDRGPIDIFSTNASETPSPGGDGPLGRDLSEAAATRRLPTQKLSSGNRRRLAAVPDDHQVLRAGARTVARPTRRPAGRRRVAGVE